LDLGFPPISSTDVEIWESVQMEQLAFEFGTGKCGWEGQEGVDGTKCAGPDGHYGFICGRGHE